MVKIHRYAITGIRVTVINTKLTGFGVGESKRDMRRDATTGLAETDLSVPTSGDDGNAVTISRVGIGT